MGKRVKLWLTAAKTRWHTVWGLFLHLNAGDDYIEGVICDISDRKRAEVALQTSEERLRLALQIKDSYDINIKTEEIVVKSPEYFNAGLRSSKYFTTKYEGFESGASWTTE